MAERVDLRFRVTFFRVGGNASQFIFATFRAFVFLSNQQSGGKHKNRVLKKQVNPNILGKTFLPRFCESKKFGGKKIR
jgi:hypothetical protein